jgi:hypothetical protein
MTRSDSQITFSVFVRIALAVIAGYGVFSLNIWIENPLHVALFFSFLTAASAAGLMVIELSQIERLKKEVDKE